MTAASLAQSYLIKARVRLTILPVLFDAGAHSDVVREAQEIVELALRACSGRRVWSLLTGTMSAAS